MIEFTVYGSPISQPRQRHRIVKPKTGGAFVTNYTPKDDPVQSWKAHIRYSAIPNKPQAPWTGPVIMFIDFFLPRPARLMRAKDPAGTIPHITKPDRDNLEKAVLDALKGIFFVDDCQVYSGEIRKFYHEKDCGPRAEIKIAEMLTL